MNKKIDDENKNKIKTTDLRFTEIEVMKEHIKEDVKKEIKTWIWKPISIFLIIAGFFGVTTYASIKQLQNRLMDKAKKDFETKIRTLYNETNVAKIVNILIKENAENLIREKTKAEIDPIIEDIKKNQQEYAEITKLNELAINAESGDRQAFEKLERIAFSPNQKYSGFAYRVSLKVYEKYNSGMFYKEWYKPTIPNVEVIKLLSDEDIRKRKLAVYTVGQRKMYDQVPTLISMIRTEVNLDVLATITRVLNELVGTEIKVLQPNSADNFMNIWQEKREKLLKNQAK